MTCKLFSRGPIRYIELSLRQGNKPSKHCKKQVSWGGDLFLPKIVDRINIFVDSPWLMTNRYPYSINIHQPSFNTISETTSHIQPPYLSVYLFYPHNMYTNSIHTTTSPLTAPGGCIRSCSELMAAIVTSLCLAIVCSSTAWWSAWKNMRRWSKKQWA